MRFPWLRIPKKKKRKKPKNSLVVSDRSPNLIQRLGGLIFERSEPRNVFETENMFAHEQEVAFYSGLHSTREQVITFEEIDVVEGDWSSNEDADYEDDVLFSDEYITILQASTRYPCTEEYLRKLCQKKLIKAIKIRQKWYIYEISLIQYIAHMNGDY